MLSKKHRLAKTQDVQLAVKTGRSFFNPYFTVKFKMNKTGVRRFTVVVSTKVSKKAVIRNRIKRVLRDEIRLKLNEFPVGDYAVLVKPKAGQIDPSELRQAFISLCRVTLWRK